MTDFLVKRDDLRTFRTDEGEPARDGADAGTVQFRVERFGLTANNITYGVTGDQLGYWQFFPAPEGWGRIPVWGFGAVTASGVDGIEPGDRFYGYWPMSTHVTFEVTPDRGGFVESSAGRAALPGFYNRYLRAVPAAGFTPGTDDASTIMRPLYLTGWLIADQLATDGWHGADTVVVGSASSKTAFTAAASVRRRDGAPTLVGLTSAANRAFTAGLGFYDEVLTYDEIGDLPAELSAVYLDMSGNTAVRRRVHERLALRASIMVGWTHWESTAAGPDDLPDPRPALFFAPAVGDRVAAALGPAEFARRIGADWAEFAERVPTLIEFEHATGADALADAYTRLVDGAVDPRKGLVFSL